MDEKAVWMTSSLLVKFAGRRCFAVFDDGINMQHARDYLSMHSVRSYSFKALAKAQ